MRFLLQLALAYTLAGCQTSAPPPPMCAPDAPRTAINQTPNVALPSLAPARSAELPRLLKKRNPDAVR